MNIKVVLSIVVALCAVQTTVTALPLAEFLLEIVEKLQELVKNVENALQSIFQNLDSGIESLANSARAEIDDMKNKTAGAEVCFQQAETNLTNAINTANASAKGFLLLESIKSLPFFHQINDTQLEVKQLASNITDGLKKCSSNVLPDLGCTMNFAKAEEPEISKLTGEVEQEITAGKSLIGTVETDAKTRTESIENTFNSQVQTIRSALQQCIQSTS